MVAGGLLSIFYQDFIMTILDFQLFIHVMADRNGVLPFKLPASIYIIHLIKYLINQFLVNFVISNFAIISVVC